MSQESSIRALNATLKRRKGMDPEKRKEVRAQNTKMNDWWGVCRHCGQQLEGSLKELLEHTHA